MNSEKFNLLPLMSVPVLLKADPLGKAHHLLLAEVTADVFTELNCSQTNLISRFNKNPELFEVLLGDLTEVGLSFAKSGYQRWLKNTDRWSEPKTKDKYKSSLLKQWAKFNEKP
jgi:hypothetical protein